MKASLVGEEVVNPGESTQVEVSVSTAGRSGTLSKTIMVETDHPDHARIPLKLTANVVVELDFATTHMRLQDLKVGDKKEQIIAFTARNPGAVKFGEPQIDGEGVAAKLVKTGTGADAGWQMKVVFKPVKSGPFSGTIQVKLLEPEQKDLRLYFSGMARGDIDVTPQRITIRRKTDDEKPETIVTLSSQKSFKVKSASDGQGYMDISVKTLEPGKKYELVITLTDKAAEKPRFGTNIRVQTSLASQAEFDIPVYVMTRPTPKGP